MTSSSAASRSAPSWSSCSSTSSARVVVPTAIKELKKSPGLSDTSEDAFVKPAPFEYVRPASVADALEALAVHPDAKVLAGGQSLVPLLSMRLAAPSVLVDINGIDELATIDTDPDPATGGVRVGALARHADVEAHEGAREVQPLLSLALSHVAHPTIRNRGTTVGSIVHADAAAEMPMVLLLLGGHVTAA